MAMPEMPGYVTERVKLLTIYPPVPSDVVVSALGGGSYGQPSMYMPQMREVVVNAMGHIELWEIRSHPKEK